MVPSAEGSSGAIATSVYIDIFVRVSLGGHNEYHLRKEVKI